MQIEHHLFPSVCHLYYPSIHPIVKATCNDFDVPYHSYPSVSMSWFTEVFNYFTSSLLLMGVFKYFTSEYMIPLMISLVLFLFCSSGLPWRHIFCISRMSEVRTLNCVLVVDQIFLRGPDCGSWEHIIFFIFSELSLNFNVIMCLHWKLIIVCTIAILNMRALSILGQ